MIKYILEPIFFYLHRIGLPFKKNPYDNLSIYKVRIQSYYAKMNCCIKMRYLSNFEDIKLFFVALNDKSNEFSFGKLIQLDLDHTIYLI